METTETVEQPQGQDPAESTLEDRIAAQFSPDGEEAEVAGDQPAESAAVEQAAPDPALELVEVEYGGKTHKVPAELKDALMAQSDYTRKTQEVARQRELLDAQVLMQQQEVQFHQSVSVELQQLQMVDAQIAQFKNIDWTNMDTDTMTRTRLALDQLKDQRNEIAGQLQNKRGQFNQQMQGLIQQAAQKGNEYLTKAIPNWGPDTQREIASYGQTEGYSNVELSSLTDPRMIKTLWKASQWDKLQSQKATTTKRAEQAPPVQRPGASNANAQANADAKYKAGLRAAKTNGQREKVIGERFAAKLGL